MKMVYLFNHYEALENEHIGIRKKMLMQMRAFSELGFEPVYIVYDEKMVVIKQLSDGLVLTYYYAILEDVYNCVIDAIKKINPSFIYMRYRIIYSPLLFEMYQKLASLEKKIICEFYTYPYDTEFDSDNLDILTDKYYSVYLKKVFSMSVNYNNYTEIMGIPSVGISNGIDLNKTPLAALPDDNQDSFNMISVSTMFPWHGYDRLIEGIHYYYKNGGHKKVVLHMIGEGKELDNYKKIVKLHKLEEHVIFYGRITDYTKLNQLFDHMNIAVGSVGMHRLNLVNVSPIKSAEYCARGIPFVINYDDVSFPDECQFVLKVDRNENPLDINEIMKFSNNCRNEKTSRFMRDYAKNNLSWTAQMGSVLKRFNIIVGEK